MKTKKQNKVRKINILMIVVLLATFIIGGITIPKVFFSKPEQILDTSGKHPVIVLTPLVKDLGNVSQTKPPINTFFEIANNGQADLEIIGIATSCGCTFASIVYKGIEGPVFSMPGMGNNLPANWNFVLPAGEKAQLKVTYDPNVHKDFRGDAIREINVFSNDSVEPIATVRIELTQVD